MANFVNFDKACGLQNPLQNLAPQPIISKRDPTGNDKGATGQLWVNKVTNSAWLNAGLVAGATVWNALVVQAGAGVFTSLEATTGNITADLGSVVVTTGNVTVTAGSITAFAGSITGGTVIATTDLSGLQVFATGDTSGGIAATTSLTNVVNTAISTGTLAIKSTTANPGNSAGFIKMYVGTTVVFVPYFTNIAP